MFVLGLIGFKKPLTEGLDPIKNLGTIKVYNHKVPLNKSEGVPTEISWHCVTHALVPHMRIFALVSLPEKNLSYSVEYFGSPSTVHVSVIYASFRLSPLSAPQFF